MISIKINSHTELLPESWNELSLAEARCFAIHALDGVEKENLKLSLLLTRFPELKKTLRKLGVVQLKGNDQLFWECTEDLTLLMEKLYNFLYKQITIKGNTVNVIDSKLTIQLIPSISGLIGPENFSKLEIWEFSLAEMAFNDYFTNGNPESLDRLIAILFRPKKSFLFLKKNSPVFNGDPRQLFNDQLIASRIKKIAAGSTADKYLVSLWFEGWLKRLPELFPKLYEKKTSELGEKGSWSDTILLVARNEHHEADQVARRNLYQFLRERELQIIERQQMEEEMQRIHNSK
jgi:hypothetical protein